MRISLQELLIVLAVVIVILGPTQIPKLAKMLGKGVKGAKNDLDAMKPASDNVSDDVQDKEE